MCVEITFVLDIVAGMYMASNHDSIKCESPQKGTLIIGVFLGTCIEIACGVSVIVLEIVAWGLWVVCVLPVYFCQYSSAGQIKVHVTFASHANNVDDMYSLQ